MAKTPAVPDGKQVPVSCIKELERLILQRSLLVGKINDANDAKKARIARVEEADAKKRQPTLDKLAVLDRQLKELLTANKRSLWRRFGKTIKLPGGVIRYRVSAKSLDTPKNVSAIIEFLLALRGGRRYLVFRPELNRDALTHANKSLLGKLVKRFAGFWVGRHETITVKSVGELEPKTLVRRRYHAPSQ